jgi:hypothetical protein
VHRARNLYANLPERERERVKHAYRRALDEAISGRQAEAPSARHELDNGGYTAASSCLADDLDALVVHVRYPPGTAGGGGQRICSSAPLARSRGRPR